MGGSYSIGELAKAAGVPASTVRFYERQGLLSPDSRTRARYRVYGGAALERLRFIRAAQATGFTLGDIAALLMLRDEGTGGRCCAEVSSMISARLAEVETKLGDLRRVRGMLRDAKRICRASPGPCPVISKLAAENLEDSP